jgi:hypothetical protein
MEPWLKTYVKFGFDKEFELVFATKHVVLLHTFLQLSLLIPGNGILFQL